MNAAFVIFVGLMTMGELVWTPPARSQADTNVDADLQDRLKKLSDEIEAGRNEFNIPGIALTIVKDDTVILSRGFGLANTELQTPVNDRTVFSIGSSTKALTATLIAMLVTDGTMSWDDSITDYLPEFKLPIKREDVNDRVTIRDLLSHRTGFHHMGMVGEIFRKESHGWTRDKLLRAAVRYEPQEVFRKKFIYNNIGFLAAGIASGKAAGTDWDSLMVERMFKPLGMESSTTLTRQALKDPNLAVGYMSEGGTNKPIPLKDVDMVGPAGGVLTNARDMGQWLRFILNRGRYNGKCLIDRKEVSEMWTKQISGGEPLPPEADYGLGWIITEWKGHLVVSHGGYNLGFSSELALLPDHNLGFAILSNVFASPLQERVKETVWEALLDE